VILRIIHFSFGSFIIGNHLTALLTHHTKPEPVSAPPAEQTEPQGKGKLWEKLFGKMKV